MDIWVALLLVSFGLLFLILEVFIFPGVGISGVLGIVCLGVGIVIAFRLDTLWGIFTLGGSVVGTSIMVYLSIKYDTFSKMSLTTNINAKVEVNHLKELKPNDEGIAISRLAPMGKAEFRGLLCEVSSPNGFIEENAKIIITHITNNTIFVSLNK